MNFLLFFNLGDFDLGDFDLGDFGVGDFDLGDFGIGDFDLGDFDMYPSSTSVSFSAINSARRECNRTVSGM